MRLLSLARRLAIVSLLVAAPARAETLLFLDNDFSGPGETNIQSLFPALFDADALLLGVGVVTGDAWRDEGAAHLLSFLDQVGCAAPPVFAGAEMPLLRTPSEMSGWEGRYGRLLWKGAFQAAGGRHPGQHPDRPALVPPLPEGAPRSAPRAGSAAEAMIAAVHRFPHRVLIVAGGPLTDLALAIRRDPDFPRLARGLVFMGGLLDTDLAQIDTEAAHRIDFYTDFNMIFDPEAAHAVLTAPWAQVVNMGDVTLTVPLTPALVDAAAADAGAPLAGYFHRYARAGVPMWDELTMAVALHPDLVTGSVMATMDVDTGHGLLYGRAHARAAGLAPGMPPPVRIVTAVDRDRFYALFRQGLAAPVRCPR